MEVPASRLWGAQTQRSIGNFAIGVDRFRFTRPVIRALGIVKKCAAQANLSLGQIDAVTAAAIARAAAEVIQAHWDSEFPLVVFQTGSGTQSNMNANEVIAHRASMLGGIPVHPNDDVNRSQSSNDVFPSVMHIATVEQLEARLLPTVRELRDSFQAKAEAWASVVMLGRTHLQDATPITLGQVASGWVAQLNHALGAIGYATPALYELALGGTAVGTGTSAPREFGEVVARAIATDTGLPFVSATNKFAQLSAHDAMVTVSGALRTLAGVLFKIANDIRWYGSGPRAGIGELVLPANEPGSSIMPGKTNPTQCEALTQVAVQVFGNDHAVAFAGSQGHFQLNTFKPVILHNVLESIALLADACGSFREHCVLGLEPDLAKIGEHMQGSLMLVTALTPHIGYDKAAQISLKAWREGSTLREAALALGYVSAQEFSEWINPVSMTRPD